VFTLPLLEAEDGISFSQGFLLNRRLITMLTEPLLEPEDLLPRLQILFWSQKIHYPVYKPSSGARRSIIVFTNPLLEPEDPLLCLQILFWSQKIHYCVYKASSGARRSIIVFTKPLLEPEDS
jgi:hypothetical protein